MISWVGEQRAKSLRCGPSDLFCWHQEHPVNKPLLLLIVAAGVGLFWVLATLPTDPDMGLGRTGARRNAEDLAPRTRQAVTAEPDSGSTEVPARVIGLAGDNWRPDAVELSEVMTNEEALQSVSAQNPKVALVVTQRFLSTVVQQGSEVDGGRDRDVLYQALANGHVVFCVDSMPEDLSSALGLQDAVTPWDPEGSTFPMDGYLDPNSVTPGVAVWFTDDGWKTHRVSEGRQPTRRSTNRAGTAYVFDPNFPSYDLVAPLLASILRELNSDGRSMTTASP